MHDCVDKCVDRATSFFEECVDREFAISCHYLSYLDNCSDHISVLCGWIHNILVVIGMSKYYDMNNKRV